MGDLVAAMVQEARLRLTSNPRWKDQTFTTLYLGGGTPSILPADLLQHLVSGVLEAVGQPVTDFREVTLEANPEDMTETQIQAWLELGVTRLSLGVQSFHDDTLAWMNRAHTGIQAEQAIRLAHDLGVKAMTLDLIYGVPTARDWNDDIARATALPIQHLSAYALTVEPGTVLGTRIERGAEQPAPDARTAEEYHRLCHALAAQGWSHYETSNWAAPKPDQGHHKSQHNSAYWSGAPYLALGPGAHGFLGATRYANVSNNPRYIQAIQQGTLLDERETLTPRDRYNELVMTGLRTAQGISPEQLHSTTGVRPQEVDEAAWTQALEGGRLVEHQPGWFRIPEPNWITGDQVASALFTVD